MNKSQHTINTIQKKAMGFRESFLMQSIGKTQFVYTTVSDSQIIGPFFIEETC